MSQLDLTNAHLTGLEGVELLEDLVLLDLTANRLREIDDRILTLKGVCALVSEWSPHRQQALTALWGHLAGLKILNFRQNLLTDVSCWDRCQCKGALEDLEFRDNQLNEVGEPQGTHKRTCNACWLHAAPSFTWLHSLTKRHTCACRYPS